MTDSVLQLRDLVFRWPRSNFELTCPRFDVAREERVALIGPSGCGKSTLIGLATGQQRPLRGTVHCAGREVTALSPAARRAWRLARIGLVFQEFELLDHLSALENIMLPFRLSRALRDEVGGFAAARRRGRALAERAGLGARLRRSPRRLSHGERQRVAVCRAIVTNPALVIGDEPTGSLDPETSGTIMDLIEDVVRERRCALLVVTHDHGLLPRFDRVVDVTEVTGGTP